MVVRALGEGVAVFRWSEPWSDQVSGCQFSEGLPFLPVRFPLISGRFHLYRPASVNRPAAKRCSRGRGSTLEATILCTARRGWFGGEPGSHYPGFPDRTCAILQAWHLAFYYTSNYTMAMDAGEAITIIRRCFEADRFETLQHFNDRLRRWGLMSGTFRAVFEWSGRRGGCTSASLRNQHYRKKAGQAIRWCSTRSAPGYPRAN